MSCRTATSSSSALTYNRNMNPEPARVYPEAEAELLEFVDQHDQPTGQTAARGSIKGQNVINTRYVSVFIRNDLGQLWCPSRRLDGNWPGGLDFAIGGAVAAGETYEAAAVREAAEEMALELQPSQLTEIAHLSPYKYPVGCFQKIFEVQLNDAPRPTGEQHLSGRWYDVNELIPALAVSRLPHKSDLLPVARLCYGPLKDLDRKQFAP